MHACMRHLASYILRTKNVRGEVFSLESVITTQQHFARATSRVTYDVIKNPRGYDSL